MIVVPAEIQVLCADKWSPQIVPKGGAQIIGQHGVDLWAQVFFARLLLMTSEFQQSPSNPCRTNTSRVLGGGFSLRSLMHVHKALFQELPTFRVLRQPFIQILNFRPQIGPTMP